MKKCEDEDLNNNNNDSAKYNLDKTFLKQTCIVWFFIIGWFLTAGIYFSLLFTVIIFLGFIWWLYLLVFKIFGV